MQQQLAKFVGRKLKVNRRVGAVLAKSRIESNLSVEQLAERFKISTFEILRWETGFGTLQANLYAEIAKAFSCDSYLEMNRLFTDLQYERSALISTDSAENILVQNFDALGVVSSFRCAA